MIPARLRPHLEALGAEITPGNLAGTDRVHVPGADYAFTFGPQGTPIDSEYLRGRPLEGRETTQPEHVTLRNYLRATRFAGLNYALQVIGRGTVVKDGLRATQWVNKGLHHQVVFQPMDAPKDQPHYNSDVFKVASWSRRHRLMPDDLRQGVRAVLNQDMDPTTLMDHMREHYLVEPQEPPPTPERLRRYADAVRRFSRLRRYADAVRRFSRRRK